MLLTLEEAHDILRIDGSDNDAIILPLIAAITPYLETTTGHDWAADATIHPLAKSLASVLLNEWYYASLDDKANGITRQQKAIDSMMIALSVIGRTYGT